MTTANTAGLRARLRGDRPNVSISPIGGHGAVIAVEWANEWSRSAPPAVRMRWVCPRIDELSRGGKDSGKNNHVPRLTGVHHVTVPTSDPLGTDWYVQVFGFTALLVEESESEVVAVLLQHPCGVRLLLRRAAAPLPALRGFPLFGLTVPSFTELQHWEEHLSSSGVEHSAVHQAHPGWAVTVTGPDLVRIQLQTDDGPGGGDD